jgi:hypothetical protein
LRLKYEEKRVKNLAIGSDGLTLINKENQIVRKFLSRQDVGSFKSFVLAIDLRLKHGIHRDSADLPTSVRIIVFLIRLSEGSLVFFCYLKQI